MARLPLFVGAALAFATPSLEAATPRSADALLLAEDALFAADVQHDLAAVERGFAAEAVFVHANGMVQTKADYLRAMSVGQFAAKLVSAHDRKVRISGDLGVVTGTKIVEVGDMHLRGTYLSVYVFRAGRWQLLNEQSSPAYEAQPREATR